MNDDIKARIDKAVALAGMKHFDDSRSVLEGIIKDYPDYSDAYRLAAQLDWQHYGNVDKAYDELIESLKADPKNIWALILMGNLLSQEKGDDKAADEYYMKVLEYYPDNLVALGNVGAMLAKQERYNEAIDVFKRSLKVDDTYANAYYGIALAYHELNDYKSCFDWCVEGAKKSKDKPENPGVRDQIMALLKHVAEELDKNTNYPRIWSKIKNKLEVLGDEDIVFEKDTNLNVLAKMEYGPTHGRNHHVVIYNPDREYVAHLFVHELMHLELQIADTKIGKGKAFVKTPANKKAFRNKYWQFFKKRFHNFGSMELESAFNNMYDGQMLQIMNCPLDLFVEDKIYNEYEEMRPVQFLSLLRMERTNIRQANKKDMGKYIPSEIIRVNKILNMCSSFHFKQLYGVDLLKEYHPTRDEYNQAKDLYDEYCAYVKTFNTGDEYELLEYFGESLNFEDYYTLIDEKDYIKAQYARREEEKAVENDTVNESGMSSEDVDVANAEFALNHQDGADSSETMMMALYMVAAMEYFDGMPKSKVKQTAVEIAMIGVNGIHPSNKYKLNTIPNKEFTGYQLLAYYYVSWAIAIPEMLDKLDLPFTKAYTTAQGIYKMRKNNG